MSDTSTKPFLRLWLAVPGLMFLALWIGLLELAAVEKWTNTAFSPVPSSVADHLWHILASGVVVRPVLYTLGMLAAGYLLGCLVGIALGLLMGYNRALYLLFEPLLELLRPIPKPALIPPLILFLGLGAAMEITIVFLGVLFPVLINTIQGARSVDPVLVDAARTLRCSWARIVMKVILPASLPIILSGMRVSLGIGLVLVVLSEMLTGAEGLGSYIVDLQRSFRAQEMYAWTAVLAILGLGLAGGFNWLERRLLFWSSTR